MKVKLLFHDNVILKVHSYNEETKVVVIKMFGTMCSFNEREYKVVEDDNPST